MAKKEKEITENKIEQKEVKVKFHNSYIGKLGNFQNDKVYTISGELFKIFKNDCKEI